MAHVNRSGALKISIDIPSGLFLDGSSRDCVVVKADITLTFQSYKTGLLVQENAPFIGEVIVLDIGLHPAFLLENPLSQRLVDHTLARDIFRPRNAFAHKGTYGHALVIGGSYGKIGAVTLAAQACLHGGAGLTTAYIPRCGYTIVQLTVPEAMVLTDQNEEYLSELPVGIEKFSSIGIGPGIGTREETQRMVSLLVSHYRRPLVIDADGLNCLSQQRQLLDHLPENSILTPHPREFDRLFGEHPNDFERIRSARQKAKDLDCIIVLKGHHSLIASPSGEAFFNSTGNAGMAKGGSGDVLTGILTALLSQNYEPVKAAVLGVYLHGLAGDLALPGSSQESMTATDIIRCLSHAFTKLY